MVRPGCKLRRLSITYCMTLHVVLSMTWEGERKRYSGTAAQRRSGTAAPRHSVQAVDQLNAEADSKVGHPAGEQETARDRET